MTRAGRSRWISLVCSLALVPSAFADRDVPALAMGRVTVPAGSGVVELNTSYAMQDVKQAGSDTNALEVTGEYGLTDRLSLGVGIDTNPAPRTTLQLDSVSLEARYRLVIDVLQLAPFVAVRPQFDEPGLGFQFGAATLKKWGKFLLGLDYTGEVTAFSGQHHWGHQLDLGGYYAFDLNGIFGATLVYDLPNRLAGGALLGGRINRHIFLGVQAMAGLTRDAPALTVTIQIHFYVGPYITPALD